MSFKLRTVSFTWASPVPLALETASLDSLDSLERGPPTIVPSPRKGETIAADSGSGAGSDAGADAGCTVGIGASGSIDRSVDRSIDRSVDRSGSGSSTCAGDWSHPSL